MGFYPFAPVAAPPSGAAGGILGGTYPNPTFGAGATAGGGLAGTYPNPTVAAPLALSQAAAAGDILTVTNTTSAPTIAPVEVITNASGDRALAVRTAADTFPRVNLATDISVNFGSGTAGPDVHLTRGGANLLSLTTADLDVATAGRGLRVSEGANGKQGVATLTGGTVTVANTSVTANSRIFLTAQSLGTVAVASGYAVTARVPGTSFTITASAPTDTSVIAWEIFEPG